jgi:hypothetical protein
MPITIKYARFLPDLQSDLLACAPEGRLRLNCLNHEWRLRTATRVPAIQRQPSSGATYLRMLSMACAL